MLSLQVFDQGGLDNLQIVERPIPDIQPGQILVRVTAASLNFRDLNMVQMKKSSAPPKPFVPLSDICGVVETVGEGVTQLACGDRVTSLFFQRWLDGPVTPEVRWSTLALGHPGVGSQYAMLLDSGAYKAPGFLSDLQAATLPVAALTAWRAMFEDAPLAAGSTVLLQGTGGVSIFGLQFATALGLKSIVTSSSDDKLSRAKSLGATHLINYRTTPQWSDEVKRLTDGKGVDFILGVAGGGSLNQSIGAIRLGGHIAIIGNLEGVDETLPIGAMIEKNIRLQGVSVGSRAMFGRMVKVMEDHKIVPVVDRVFPFSRAVEAFRAMESGSHFGKIVLDFTA